MNEIITEFAIAVPDEDLADLQDRLARARWPRRWPEKPWAAGTDYHAHPLPRAVMGEVPTAVAAFPHDLAVPPREFADRTYNVVRYTRFERGGHFAPHEEPELLARDIHEFVHGLRD